MEISNLIAGFFEISQTEKILLVCYLSFVCLSIIKNSNSDCVRFEKNQQLDETLQRIKFNVPSDARYLEVFHATVSIGCKDNSCEHNSLSEGHERVDKVNNCDGYNVEVLGSDNFNVVDQSFSHTQAIPIIGNAEWDFEITPIKTGPCFLDIKVTGLFNTNEFVTKSHSSVLRKSFRVDVSKNYKFYKHTLKIFTTHALVVISLCSVSDVFDLLGKLFAYFRS